MSGAPRTRSARRRLLAVALLAASALPMILVGPVVARNLPLLHDHYGARDPEELPAEAELSAADQARFAPLPATDGIPVLAYHGVADDGGEYTVERGEFARQLAMLHAAGFQGIDADAYGRFLRGDRRGLPARPVLITFDDGRLDSYRGADAVLARFGFPAVIFAISADTDHPFYLSWDELRRLQASGRWDVAFHAGRGHVEVQVDDAGHSGPFYANREVGGSVESLDSWQQRTIADLEWGVEELRRNVPDADTHLMAVPFGNYGQNETNDARIPRVLGPWLRQRFAAVFVQAYDDPPFSAPGAHRDQQRLEIDEDTTAEQLYAWLKARSEGAPYGRGDDVAPAS